MKRLLLATIISLPNMGLASAGPYEEAEAALTRRDYVEAVKQYRLAASQGNAAAEYKISRISFGNGPKHPDEEPLKWLRLAARHGYPAAQYDLGNLYQYGSNGVGQDYVQAARWYRLAAPKLADARAALGRMYRFGYGVPNDNVRAYMWLDLAAAIETDPWWRPTIIEDRDKIARFMTPLQIGEAQMLARICRRHTFKDCN
jgi:uncharacterized protein